MFAIKLFILFFHDAMHPCVVVDPSGMVPSLPVSHDTILGHTLSVSTGSQCLTHHSAPPLHTFIPSTPVSVSAPVRTLSIFSTLYKDHCEEDLLEFNMVCKIIYLYVILSNGPVLYELCKDFMFEKHMEYDFS